MSFKTAFFPIVFSILAVVYFMLFEQEKDCVISLESKEFIKKFTDKKFNGESKVLALDIKSNEIDFSYKVGNKPISYAGFDVFIQDSTKKIISNYNTIKLEFKTTNIVSFNLSARTFEKGITRKKEVDTYRYNSVSIPGSESVKVESVCFDDFTTKDWWIKDWITDVVSLETPDWTELEWLSITHEIVGNRDDPASVTLKRLVFVKNNTRFWTVVFLINVLYFLGLFSFKRRKQKSLKKREVVISYKRVEESLGKVPEDWKKNIIAFISEQYRNSELSLLNVAKEVGKHEKTVSKFFQDEFNTSFKKYLNLLRLEEAKKLLIEPSLTIKEIAYMVGYSSTNNFTRVFKQYEGSTPSEFRSSET